MCLAAARDRPRHSGNREKPKLQKNSCELRKKFAKYGDVLRFVNEVHFDTS
jgi:hypothetical protein